MAVKDRIYLDVVQAIKARIGHWRDERQGLLVGANRVTELDAMIAEAERELAVAEAKVPTEDRRP